MRTLKHTYKYDQRFNTYNSIFLEENRAQMPQDLSEKVDKMTENDQVLINDIILFTQNMCVELITQPTFQCC